MCDYLVHALSTNHNKSTFPAEDPGTTIPAVHIAGTSLLSFGNLRRPTREADHLGWQHATVLRRRVLSRLLLEGFHAACLHFRKHLGRITSEPLFLKSLEWPFDMRSHFFAPFSASTEKVYLIDVVWLGSWTSHQRSQAPQILSSKQSLQQSLSVYSQSCPDLHC